MRGNQAANTTKKKGCLHYILVALAVLFVIGAIGSVFGGGSKKNKEDTAPTEQVQQDAVKKEGQQQEQEAVEEAKPSAAVQLVSDDTLKSFIQAYEGITGTELSDIEQVGKQGYHATTAGHTLELTYVKTSATIQIDNNGEFNDMRQLFHDAANALDPSLGDNAYSLFDEGVAKMSTEEDGFIELESFNVNFSAPNEYEDGHIQLIVKK